MRANVVRILLNRKWITNILTSLRREAVPCLIRAKLRLWVTIKHIIIKLYNITVIIISPPDNVM